MDGQHVVKRRNNNAVVVSLDIGNGCFWCRTQTKKHAALLRPEKFKESQCSKASEWKLLAWLMFKVSHFFSPLSPLFVYELSWSLSSFISAIKNQQHFAEFLTRVLWA